MQIQVAGVTGVIMKISKVEILYILRFSPVNFLGMRSDLAV